MRRQTWRREEISGFVADKLREYGYLSPADLPVDPFKIAALEGLHVDFRPLNGTRGWLVKGPLIATAMLDESQPFHHTFTLAHELIHYWIHPPGVYQDADGKGLFERQASRAAAELLMPASWVHEMAGEAGPDVGRLAQVFGVSRQAMEIRLEELGLALRQDAVTKHKEGKR